MTDQEFDQLLQKALLETVKEELTALNRVDVSADWTPSERYRQFETELLSNARQTAQTHHGKNGRFQLRRVFRQAACLLLICAVGFCGWLAVDAEARSTLLNWTRTLLQDGEPKYNFYGAPTQQGGGLGRETRLYELTQLPEGYALTTSRPANGHNNLGYEKGPDDPIIWLSYDPMEEGTALFLFTEGGSSIQTEVNGCPADLYIQEDKGYNSVVWMDQAVNLCFTLSGPIEKDELLHMAESVVYTGTREAFPFLVTPMPEDFGLDDERELFFAASRDGDFSDLTLPWVGVYAEYEKDGSSYVICRVIRTHYYDCDAQGVFQRTEKEELLLRMDSEGVYFEETYVSDEDFAEQVRALCSDTPGLADQILDGTAPYLRQWPGAEDLFQTYCSIHELALSVAE